MANHNLYPLKFHPQLKEKVWGGDKLKDILGKTGGEQLGESWEISAVEGNISVVSNGLLKGEDLQHLIQKYGSDLLGEKVTNRFGEDFPLLFKFIDAREDLSVQLHPNDEVASLRHNSFGKTEMWYIMDADPDARLILGFDEPLTPSQYQKILQEGSLVSHLHSENIQKGDAFFIAPGTVHAIGAGVLLAEIQQTSDITYRIYDWDRPGLDGKMRELHTEEAMDVINFESIQPKVQYQKSVNELEELCSSDYFSTRIIELTDSMHRNISALESFVVYMCVEGNAEIHWDGQKELLNLGDSLLVPANLHEFSLKSSGATLLEVHVP